MTDRNAPPTLFLMVGLPGSGKTTLARQLEVEHKALRLTPDEWIPILYGDALDQETLDGVRDPVETMQWQVAARALELGVNVILDFGFWGRGERDAYRARAAALGAQSKICFLDVPYAELSARLAARNANLPPGMFHVTQAQLDLWDGWFERPLANELL
jgi:predicted kinase